MNAPNELPKDRGPLRLVAAFLFCLLASVTVNAQQITGTPGSPSATTTIPGNQLPAPPKPFGGVIKESANDSTPYWPETIVPPKGAPAFGRRVVIAQIAKQHCGLGPVFPGI